MALQADGWILRRTIVWHKPSPMPESIKDRPTTAHEYVFLLSAAESYCYDAAAIREPAGQELGILRSRRTSDSSAKEAAPSIAKRRDAGVDSRTAGTGSRNKRSVWTIASQSYSGAHCATMPPALVEPCILAGCPPGGLVLDPFAGACTAGLVALRHGRRFVGIDLSFKSLCEGAARLAADPLIFQEQRQVKMFK